MPSAPQTASAPAQHGLAEHSHGGWATRPVQSRAERFASSHREDFPRVTGLEPEWRLTPVRELGALLDGALDGGRYDVEAESGLASVTWIPRDDARIGSAGLAEDRAAANAWESVEGALLLSVPEGAETELVVRRAAFGPEPRAAHTVVEARAGSRSTIVLESTGAAQLAENVEILVREGAQLTLVSVQEWDEDARHLASHFARLERDAVLRHIVVSLGGRIVRVNPSAELAGEGSDVEMLGVYFSLDGQHLEHRTYVHHAAAHTRSRVTYKGALQGAGARSVWVGDVLIGPDASGTDSYEQNRNLVLTEGARADSVPNLEIETGDIVGAGHASATGRFDDEQLFYLQSRGIREPDARRLVVLGFLGEIVQRIGRPELERHLHARIARALGDPEAQAPAAGEAS